MPATISILGLYQQNPGIFDGLSLPEGLDHETQIDTILQTCAEFEVLYPDPVYMERTVMLWSRRNYDIWVKLANTLNLEYNPIENYDRKEDWNDKGDTTGNSIGKATGYNSNELVTANGADTKVNNKSEHSGRIHGNIGVTTTQQMIEEERRVVKFNLYDYIADQFKNDFCLLIY